MDKRFVKHKEGKLKYSLIPQIVIDRLAEVLAYGEQKYGANNWKLCEDTTVYLDAMYRHLAKWRNGEKRDQESNLTHLQHILANVSFILYLEENENEN